MAMPSGTIAPAPRTHDSTFAFAPTLAPGPTIDERTTAPAPIAAPGGNTLSSTVAPAPDGGAGGDARLRARAGSGPERRAVLNVGRGCDPRRLVVDALDGAGE